MEKFLFPYYQSLIDSAYEVNFSMSKNSIGEFSIEKYDLFIFDIEGVLVEDIDNPTAYEDALKFMKRLVTENRTFVCLSNVGRKSHRYIYNNLKKLGFPVSEDIVFSAGKIAAYYFSEKYPNARIFLISEGGAYEDFVRHGLNVVDNPPIDFVVVAMDRSITYQKLNFAARMLLNGAKLVGVGGGLIVEGTYFGDRGKFLGEDAFVYMLSKATGVEPFFIGKPHKVVFEILLNHFKVTPKNAIMIGDKIETDIIGGKKAGLSTLLINRGRYRDVYINQLDNVKKPDFVVKSFYELL